jgi:DNA topoisomerase-3
MSYPRTDSRFLSTDLYGEIESHVQSCNFGKFKQYIDKINFSDFTMSKSYFNDNKVSDHHALIPTINGDICNIYDRLTEAERNCFDEVAASLISIFYPEYVYETTEITASIGGKKFKSSGTTVINNGYKEVQKLLKETAENGNDEDNIPELQEGEELNVASVGVNENKTKPPARYNPGNIIKLMGKYKIGTAATSAGIIQSLITRKFIKIDNGKYTSTELGRNFLGYVPAVLKSPNMTIEFEERLQKVNTGDVSQESFINGLTDEITRNKNYFLDHLPEERLNVRQPLGKCPLCGGNMRDGKKGWYCENYAGSPKCGFSVWKEISGKKIPETEAKKIFEKGKSGLINGFVSKKTGKKFSAYLVIEDDRVVFSFPDKK